jgi:hypothetical protein
MIHCLRSKPSCITKRRCYLLITMPPFQWSDRCREAKDVIPMGSDQVGVDAPYNERLKRRPGLRGTERVEAPIIEVRDPGTRTGTQAMRRARRHGR